MIKPLTSLRFVAALLVFFYHVGIWKVYQTGYVGVSFFFILSGFILCLNYREKFTGLDWSQVKKFYLARFAKIYPVHVLTFLLAIPYYFLIPLKHSVIMYVFQGASNLLLLHSYIPVGNFSFNGPSWSISDEFFFYAVFPFIVYFLIKFVGGIGKRLFCICLLWLGMCTAAVLSYMYISGAINSWLFYVFPLTRIFEFLAGVVLGLVFLEVRERYSRIPRSVYSVLELSSILFMIGLVWLTPHVMQNLRYGLIFTPLLSIVIFIFAFQKGIVSGLLSNKLLVYLGEISFSFYMVHNLVLSYVYWGIFKLDITPATIIGCFLVTVALSSILYYFYEEPLRKKIRYARTGNHAKSAAPALTS